MGYIYIIKPQSTVLNSAINKSHQHQEKNYWDGQELYLGLLSEKQVCYLGALRAKANGSYSLLLDQILVSFN